MSCNYFSEMKGTTHYVELIVLSKKIKLSLKYFLISKTMDLLKLNKFKSIFCNVIVNLQQLKCDKLLHGK